MGKKDNAILSVIVPMYNVQNQIVDLLTSLNGIDFDCFSVDVILIDDGSSDFTLNKVHAFLNQTTNRALRENTQVISIANSGQSVARNVGLRSSRATYIWFVDSDDVLRTEVVNKQILPLLESGTYDFVQLNYCRFMTTLPNLAERTSVAEKVRPKDLFRELAIGKIDSFPWVHIVKNKLIKSSDFFPEDMAYEDVATSYTLIEAAQSIVKLNEVAYFYRYRRGSITLSSDKNKIDDFYHALGLIKQSANVDIANFGKNTWNLFISRMLMVIYVEMLRSRDSDAILKYKKKLSRELCEVRVKGQPFSYSVKYLLMRLNLLGVTFRVKDFIQYEK